MTKQAREIDKIIGDKILSYRLAKNISRKDMANVIGITHQQIHKYEKGQNRISVSRLFEICDYLGVPPHILLDVGDDDSHLADQKVRSLIHEIEAYLYMIDDVDKLLAIKNLAKSIGEK